MSRHAALPALALLMAGCSVATPPAYGPAAFRLGLDEAAAPARAAGVPVVIPADQGVLTVQFGHLLAPAQRRLLATLADVDRVTIHLAGTGVDQTATIAKADLTGGTASHTFVNLPPGALTVTIKALDAGGTTIGLDIQQATVTTGLATTVSSTLRLAPGVATERDLDRTPLNGPGSGGSGGGTSTGSLQTDVTIVEPTVTDATYLGAYDPPNDPFFDYSLEIDVDADGTLWTGWEEPSDPFGNATGARISKAGTVSTFDMGIVGVNWAVRRQPGTGTMVVFPGISDFRSIVRWNPGASAPTSLSEQTFSRFPAVAADGRLYTYDTGFSDLVTFDAANQRTVIDADAGTILGLQAGLSDTVVTLKLAPKAAPAVGNDFRLRRLRVDGSVVHDILLGSNAVANDWSEFSIFVDAADRTWVVPENGTSIQRYAADGTPLAMQALSHPTRRFYTDHGGTIWGYPDTDGILTRFAADGTPAAYYYLGEELAPVSMAVTPDGHVWVMDGSAGRLFHFTVTVP